MGIAKRLWLATGALVLGAAFSLNAAAACVDCGTVVNLKKIKKEGEASGAGAVIGGIAGGVLGHQVGRGRGNDVATIAGAAGGAYAGHQVEKSRNAKIVYEVVVKLEDGHTRVFNYNEPTSYHIGDKVRIDKGALVRR